GSPPAPATTWYFSYARKTCTDPATLVAPISRPRVSTRAVLDFTAVMLRLVNLSLARGVRVLYRGVTLTAAPGERVVLVGANGCGRSTLFAASLDEIAAEHGAIEAPPQGRIAHVAQDIASDDQTASDYVLGGHAPLAAARAELVAALASDDDLRIAHA